MSRHCQFSVLSKFCALTVLVVIGISNSASAGVIASLGPLTHSSSGTTLSSDISLEFTSDLSGQYLQLVSFDLINSESSFGLITDFSGFTFSPAASFSDVGQWIDLSSLNRLEFFSLTGGDLIGGPVVFGTISFDYSTLSPQFGQPGQFITLDITGTVEFLDPDGPGPEPEGDQPTSSAIFNVDPGANVIPVGYDRFVPGSQTYAFGGSGNNPIPEPTSIYSFLVLASVLGMGRRRHLAK